MQSLDGGASGSNGRHSQNRPDGTLPAPDSLEGGGGAHGSLMQRYRGAGAAPEARGTDGPPLPPPRPADASESAGSGAGGWSKAARSWSLDTPAPVAPAASTPTTTPTPPSTAGSPPSTTPTGAPVLGSPPPRPSTPATPPVTVTRGSSPGSSAPAPSQGVTVTRGTTPGLPATPATPAAPAAAAPAAASGAATLAGDQADEFKRRWREVQGDFVDDPQQAVRGAEALAREILDALATRIADKQRVDNWKAGAGAPTEDLRLALRAYRTLVDRLIEL